MVIVTPILHLVDICDFYLFSIRAFSSWKKHMSGLSLDNYSRTIPSPQGLDMVYPSFGLLWWLRRLKNTGNAGNSGWIPGLGRSPGEGNGYPFQYSCLENSRDRGAWWATAHGVSKAGHDWVTDTTLHYYPSFRTRREHRPTHQSKWQIEGRTVIKSPSLHWLLPSNFSGGSKLLILSGLLNQSSSSSSSEDPGCPALHADSLPAKPQGKPFGR